MRQILKDLMLVVYFVLMFAALPFALSPDNPLHQPPQPPADPVVAMSVNAPWGAISLTVLGALVVFTLVSMANFSNTATHTIEQVEEQRHD
jgi:hypothetical protein